MPLIFNLTLRPELEAWICDEARRDGTTPEAVAVRILESEWSAARDFPRRTEAETELLARINQGLPEAFWERFRLLRSRGEEASLTETERLEYLSLSEAVEIRNLERMEALSELARLRGVSLRDIVQQLETGSLHVPRE